jgi:ribonucleoside-diphosphate reductase alpha chain
MAKSLVDYIFRWLNFTFPNGAIEGMASGSNSDGEAKVEVKAEEPVATSQTTASSSSVFVSDTSAENSSAEGEPRVDKQFGHFMEDAPACDLCGAITVRNGACYRCYNCGNSMGCS